MFRLFGLLLVGLLLAGCQTYYRGKGMSAEEFNAALYSPSNKTVDDVISNLTDQQICKSAIQRYERHKEEARRRNLNCKNTNSSNLTSRLKNWSNERLCLKEFEYYTATIELRARGVQNCEKSLQNADLCSIATSNGKWSRFERKSKYVLEAKRRGLTCGVSETSATQIASSNTSQSNTRSSAELTAAQKEAERLRQQLAALKAEQEQQQQTISSDTQIPLITATSRRDT